VITIPGAPNLENDMTVDMDLVVGLLVVVEEVSSNIKEVEKESLKDERMNSDNFPMATSEPEIDELFDDKTAHLILAEDMGTASEGEVMGLLGESSKTPSFVNGKKGKEHKEQVKSVVQDNQEDYQYDDIVRGHLHFCLAGHYNLSEALFPSARILSLLRSSSSPCEARSHPRSSFADYLRSFADYPRYFAATLFCFAPFGSLVSLFVLVLYLVQATT
jgi:hypothetical protein